MGYRFEQLAHHLGALRWDKRMSGGGHSALRHNRSRPLNQTAPAGQSGPGAAPRKALSAYPGVALGMVNLSQGGPFYRERLYETDWIERVLV